VRVFRRRENEILEINFEKVYLVSVFDLVDTGEFYLYASEKDMQSAILVQPSLIEEGFRPISKESSVKPGFIDILGVDKNNVLTVIEIKRKAADKRAVQQLKKYMDVFKPTSEEVRGIIVAPELAKGAQKMLASLGLEFKVLSPKRCAEILKHKHSRKIIEFFEQGIG
jgi:RecB family endonuclease NucS